MRTFGFISDNKFFIKLLLTYCLILTVGLGFTSFFITSSMSNKLIETEARYETEILQKLRLFSEDKFKRIDRIFAESYWKGTNISDLVNPNNINLTATEKKERIQTIINNVCWANDFIEDILVLDYTKNEVYFSTNGLYRDISVNYNFFDSQLVKTIRQHANTKGIYPNYIPDYLIGDEAGIRMPVITVYINLYDTNNISENYKNGAMALNFDPRFFGDAYRDSMGNIKGQILVMDLQGFVYFDSSGKTDGRVFPFGDFGWERVEDLSSNQNYLINKLVSDATGLVFVDIVDKKLIQDEARNVRFSVINIIGLCIIASILIGVISLQVFIGRIKGLVRSMKLVETGGFNSEIRVKSNDEIGYLESSFNRMCRKLDEYIKSVYISEIKLKSSELKSKTAELKALQSQINPHFMFNTLESIRVMAKANRDSQTARMIHILGNMFRWNIRMKELIVSVADEEEYIRSYIELLLIRYENCFQVILEMEKEILSFGIPKLVIQPILENAIYHGIAGRQGGKITISGYRNMNCTIIEIQDNGMGMETNRLEEVLISLNKVALDTDLYNIGLKNVHQRLRLMFGEPYGLEIMSEPNCGTIVKLVLPALMKEEMVVLCTE